MSLRVWEGESEGVRGWVWVCVFSFQNEPESEIIATTPSTTTTQKPRIIDSDGLAFRPLNKQHIPVRDVVTFTTTTANPVEDVTVDDDDDEAVEDETVDATAVDDETADETEALTAEEDGETERETETVGLQDVSATANAKLHRHEEPQYSSLQRIAPEPAPLASKVLYIGLGLAGVALLAFMGLAIVLLRRKSPMKEGFAPVDTFASPEERHVDQMQSHGYTNPFFNHVHQYSKAWGIGPWKDARIDSVFTPNISYNIASEIEKRNLAGGGILPVHNSD